MSDLWRLHDLLQHVAYKPGWDFEARLVDGGNLVINRRVPNAHPPHEVDGVIAATGCWIDLDGSDAEILRAVYDAIEDCEKHEAREWFRVDGEVVFDPHRDDA